MTLSNEPIWIETDLALAIHDRQLAEHSGPVGARDASAVESVLVHPRNHWAYGEIDLCALAAAYAYRISRNHPFADGSQRTSWVIARLFLTLNNIRIMFEPQDSIKMVLSLADSALEESNVADWFRQRRV